MTAFYNIMVSRGEIGGEERRTDFLADGILC
jgi:hypothetical protein